MTTCTECGAEAPAHYGSCSLASPAMKEMFGRLAAEQVQRPAPAVLPARQQDKTLAGAKVRVRMVAEGGTINGTYRMFPDDALAEFRNDLILILGAL